ncbi:Ig-like domain-containing protein [Anaeromicropila herbilytica]|uniref:BIG2 domain-containing protein n=1 Tax=Anaeromicropila herbilytica TaxID=2785025 RepID=A0A7R7ENT7_9FIRM|nr:Ig-like domain-containing protein [Anaeromicropila herbilytica]BCN32159.1 hypothetical protein bsdtb5_34540 [Anaeromicropila herbilytica]
MKKKLFSDNAAKLHIFFLLTAFLIISAFFVSSPTAKAAASNDNKRDPKLNVNSKSLIVDTTYSLKLYNVEGYKVIFKSDDSNIASVNDDGLIEAKKNGETYISVIIRDGSKTVDTLKCTITVGPAAKSIVFSQKGDILISVNKKKYLKVILIPNNTIEEADFSSSDPSIVTVDSNGKITAVSKGTAYIYAKVRDDEACCKIIVTDNTDSDN